MDTQSATIKQTAIWAGAKPTNCDVCNSRIVNDFSDAPVYPGGPWGILCPKCAKAAGVQYGTGKGQRYARANWACDFIKQEG